MAKEKLKVVVTDYEYPHLDEEKRVFDRIGAELIGGQCQTEDEIISLAAEAQGILNQYAQMTPRVLQALPQCRVIVRYGIGVDTIDIPAATQAGVMVCNVPLYGIQEVSDHVIGLLLACIRKLQAMNALVRNGVWDCNQGRPVYRIHKRTLGLVGFGNIPRMVAQKMKPWELRILAYDPYVSDEVFGSYGVVRAPIDELLGESDYVSSHLPLTPETQHFFSYERFKQMKKGAFFVNTARGGVVDERGLTRALQEDWLAGAALDVMEKEPPDPHNSLINLPNVLITPHFAWYSVESAIDLQRMAAEEIARVFQGENPWWCLNPAALAANKKPE
ncbi:MAG: C-terminal binding protein [Desulfobacterales bacterium]|nr:MAG: C-terminal binding protein [Desulfobacterales bacterium]